MLGDRIKKCKAVVTDSPNVMKRLRLDFCAKYPWIVNVKCVLHVMNLIIQDFVKHDLVEPWAKEISILVTFFSKSHTWNQVLRDWGDKNGQTEFLSSYIEVRWYSFVKMCTSVKAFENGFRYCLTHKQNNKSLPTKVAARIQKPQLFENVKFLCTMLKPFTDAIAVLERENTHLGEVWLSFFQIHKYLEHTMNKELFPAQYLKLHTFLLERMEVREKSFDEALYIVAFYLMPKYRKICVSGRYSALDVHVMALDLARKWFDIDEDESTEFSSAILKYHKNQFLHHTNEQDPVKYWSQFNNGSSKLAAFALLLFKIIPSAASIERLFSKLARTKTKYRNRMLPSNLASHGIVKLEVLNEFHVGGRKDIDIEAKMEWEFDDIDFEKVEEEEEDEQNEEFVEVNIDDILNVANNIVPRFDYQMDTLQGQVISAKPTKAANYNYRSRDAFNLEDYN